MGIIKVKIGNVGHDILVRNGILKNVRQELVSRHLDGPVFIITHPRIRKLYGDDLLGSWLGQSERPRTIDVREGEDSKSLEMAAWLYTQFIRAGADRSAIIVALGGGVVGDLAGFVAATYLRGVRLVQVPTTLLAQIDSAIGGKVGVNHQLGKNLIGAFFQPSLIVVDPQVLGSLPRREWRSGLLEAVKYGVIADFRLFSGIEAHVEQLKARDVAIAESIIEACAAIKARVVGRDEKEGGLRMILNFGHTVGHALETITDYTRFKHGEAVGWGMLFAVHFSQHLGFLRPAAAARIRNLILSVGLPRLPDLRSADIVSAMWQDKKRHGTSFRFILPVRIGKVVIHETNNTIEISNALKSCGIAC